LADSDTGEKSEEPTPQKLRKAREKGQVSKSSDAVTAMVFLGTTAVVFGSFSSIAHNLSAMMYEAIEATQSKQLMVALVETLKASMFSWLIISLPIIGCAMGMGLLGNYMQIGFLFTAEPLKPDIKKLNPIAGIKKLFGKKRIVEVLKQVVKFTLVAVIVYHTFKASLASIILTQRSPDIILSVTVVGELIKAIVLRVSLLFFVIAAADFFWQKYVFKKSMMMSKYDIKKEYKESEGDPHQKGERKRLAQDLVMHGSQQNVKNADAVVTNPAHIACAVKYDENSDAPPVLVAKGLRKNAQKIKEIAVHYDVPILRNVPLAQELNKLEIDEEVPEELFEAVAEILNFVYELKEQGKG